MADRWRLPKWQADKSGVEAPKMAHSRVRILKARVSGKQYDVHLFICHLSEFLLCSGAAEDHQIVVTKLDIMHPTVNRGAAPDAPNPSPSQKVRSSDGSWGGARNIERPVGGARSRARHLGGEREAKARRVGGSEDQGEASGGNEDQGKARGGSEKQERDKWGEQRTRRQGQRVRCDVHNRVEAPNDVHSRAESRVTSTAEQQGRATSTAELQCRATSTAELQCRATSTAEHSHRATSTDERRLRGDDVRLAGVWNSPRGVRVGARCCRNSPPLATDTKDATVSAVYYSNAY
ncbi:hypothetical protein QTP86_005292 [Hemibagrus guttatus]|nr:hypothetical protein QTP86_005292 [Hemibagrus guttatus]